jgi:type I restriction enzyme S subunit
MKTCDLKEIIYLPSGIFTYTSIKTCVFYFVKKREGSDVLETTIKSSKTQKENGRTYKFSKTHQTTKVAFYDFNPYEDVKNLLVEVPIEKIVNNSYSLNYAEYMKDDSVEDKYEEDVLVKTLGEVCAIIKGEKKRSKDGKEVGLYPLYYCSILGHLYLDTFDYSGEGIIINKTNGSGKAMVYYGNNKYNVGETTLHFKSNNDEIKTKYVYYYLFHNIELIQKYFKGANQKSIVEDDLFKIKIPIPSLEKQQTIVAYLDYIYEKANKTSLTKIEELKQLNEFCLNNQKLFGEYNVKELGEVCDMSTKGNTNSKEISNTGEYPFYKASVSNPSGTHNTFCFDDIEYLLFIKSGGNSSNPLSLSHGIGKVYLVNGKSSGNTEVVKIKNNDFVMLKYLYYYLKNEQLNIQKLAKYSTNLGHIDMNKFKEIKIPVPSLEKQKEIVAYCDYNTNLIKQLENEIENNKILAEQFIKGIVKNVGVDTEVDVGELEVEE